MYDKTLPFSVAMSIYKNDNPEYLGLALDSICQQSLVPNEIYLVIDGPIGKELEQVLEFYTTKYDFFTINRLMNNVGLGRALNIAINNCQYDLIARMDSDDISAPGRFRKQVAAFMENDVDVVGGWTLGFFGDLNKGQISTFNPKTTDEGIKKQLSFKSPISHPAVMYRKNAVLKSGNYIHLQGHEDYYLWTRMVANGCKFMNLPEYILYYRCNEGVTERHSGKEYFDAEMVLRKYMLEHKLTTKGQIIRDVGFRLIYQRILGKKGKLLIEKTLKRKYISREEADVIIHSNIEEDEKFRSV